MCGTEGHTLLPISSKLVVCHRVRHMLPATADVWRSLLHLILRRWRGDTILRRTLGHAAAVWPVARAARCNRRPRTSRSGGIHHAIGALHEDLAMGRAWHGLLGRKGWRLRPGARVCRHRQRLRDAVATLQHLHGPLSGRRWLHGILAARLRHHLRLHQGPIGLLNQHRRHLARDVRGLHAAWHDHHWRR